MPPNEVNIGYFFKNIEYSNGPPKISIYSNYYLLPIIVNNSELWKRIHTSDGYTIEEQVFNTVNEKELYDDYLLEIDIQNLCKELSSRK